MVDQSTTLSTHADRPTLRAEPVLNVTVLHKGGALILSALPYQGLVRIQVNGKHPNIEAELAEALDCPMPQPGHYSESHKTKNNQSIPCRIHWLTPTEWLVVMQDGSEKKVQQVLQTLPVFTDLISDSRVSFSVTGSEAQNLLAEGCSLDWANFPPGSSTVTRLDKVPVLLARIEHQRFEVMVDRSYGSWIWSWLKTSISD